MERFKVRQAMNPIQSLTLSQLNKRITGHLSAPDLTNVWVRAELSDFRSNGGHLYMELIEKNETTGAISSRIRGIIWATTAMRLRAKFRAATGSELRNGLKVLVCGSVNYHVSYGISFVINDIDPSFTLGDIERRRNEILMRLRAEGVENANKELEWSVPTLRIAVISAAGAAGYGDFINQLYNNQSRLKFVVKLFPAILQGVNTAPSVIAALNEINAQQDRWDCVVIIRGGGATSDLVSFDDYDLANNVAQFPLPIIVGIGHERDVTVLDYVANMRVKTPTAAAEWLISQAEAALDSVRDLAAAIHRAANQRLSGALEQIAYLQGRIPAAADGVVAAASGRLQRCGLALEASASRCIAPQQSRLDSKEAAIKVAIDNVIRRKQEQLNSMKALLDVLSPVATLKRGYTITRINGRAVTSVSSLSAATEIETIFADGKVISVVK